MEVLGLIPARGGSKGIPRKNLAPLAGRPLLAYTCSVALVSEALDRVVLSTEDSEIASVGRSLGVEVPFRRPTRLAGDRTEALPVIQHAIEWLAEEERYHPSAVALLQPTSPLRKALHIDEAVGLLDGSDADSVVSVVEVPHAYSPASVMRIEDGRLVPYASDTDEIVTRRQDKPRVYARNGPAVLVSRVDVLTSGELYGETVLPYVMGWPESIDVDTRYDLELAEFFLGRG